jgi:hypothetical protein
MNLIDTAHEFIQAGFNPLPLNENKSPNLPIGHPFLYERIDKVEQRFYNTAKIGIVCGEISDGFYCIDFDAHNGEPINEVFEPYIAVPFVAQMIQDGKLSVYKTAGGGYHMYFYNPEEVMPGAKYSFWETKSTMIELRGNGQYVACYPSEGYKHIMGVDYFKLTPLEGELPMLVDLARSFNRYKEASTQRAEKSDRKWPDSWKVTTPDGKYNIECEQEAKGLLLNAGWKFAFERKDGTEYWVRPGKEIKDGTSATFNHFKGMFYVFSEDANCEPFTSHQAYSPFNILTLLQYNGDWRRAKDYLRDRFNMVDNEQFWNVSDKGNYSLNNAKFRSFLETNDFFKTYPNESSSYNFVQKDGIFLKLVYETDIKDFIINWIDENKCPDGVFNLMTSNLKFFKREHLNLIKTSQIKTLKDSPNECFLFYKNCIVKITKDTKEILSYDEIGISIWKDQVINRDYTPTDHHPSEYRTFVWKIAGENEEKYKAFQTVIGYLLHSYKSNSNNKAIIFNDELISENPNGRSGKGLFWNALKQIRKVQSLDGKTFDFNKSFPYQSVSTDCQILVFDDVKRNFNFENLFSVITEGITIEYKGKDSIKLNVTESPKIIITTNYTIEGDSASFKARKYEVEMSSYFSDMYTPIDEFKHQLFDDWDDAEWARFDNYMAECIKIYLNSGLIEMPLKNLDFRKLVNEIGNEMHLHFQTIRKNEWHATKDVYENLLSYYPELKKRNITQNKMTINFRKFCEYYKHEYKTTTSGGISKLIIYGEQNDPEENNIIPF